MLSAPLLSLTTGDPDFIRQSIRAWHLLSITTRICYGFAASHRTMISIPSPGLAAFSLSSPCHLSPARKAGGSTFLTPGCVSRHLCRADHDTTEETSQPVSSGIKHLLWPGRSLSSGFGALSSQAPLECAGVFAAERAAGGWWEGGGYREREQFPEKGLECLQLLFPLDVSPAVVSKPVLLKLCMIS